MTTAVIVQARMGSNRLPGKIMLELGGRTVLHQVLSRCAAIPGADVVVCAVPNEPDSDAIEAVARDSGALIFRGSELDVLARYLGAARAVTADIVMRVTSDCPLIDPQVCDEVLALRKRENADYAANNMVRSFPHGLDCEAFMTEALAESSAAASAPGDREHVTPWLRRAAHLKRANLAAESSAFAHLRWTLDYPEDYAFFQALWPLLPEGRIPLWQDVARLIESRPELAALNAVRNRA